jgi:hypothetical protein
MSENTASWQAPKAALWHCRVKSKRGRIPPVKYWEIIADNLSKSGWSWGCVSAIDSNGRTIWIAGAHRGDGKRFVAGSDEKLTAFLELARNISTHLLTKDVEHNFPSSKNCLLPHRDGSQRSQNHSWIGRESERRAQNEQGKNALQIVNTRWRHRS